MESSEFVVVLLLGLALQVAGLYWVIRLAVTAAIRDSRAAAAAQDSGTAGPTRPSAAVEVVPGAWAAADEKERQAKEARRAAREARRSG